MKSRIKPMRQGACDRLCGAYAVVNAVSALSPTLTLTEKNNLFKAMLYTVATKRKPAIEHLWAGFDNEDIDKLLDVAADFLKPRLEYLVYRRFRRSRGSSASDLLKRLRQELDDGSVAILRVEFLDSKHWTVAYKIGKRHIRLLDSAGMDDLTRDQCCLGRQGFKTRLLPTYFRILRMQDDAPEPLEPNPKAKKPLPSPQSQTT